MWHFTTHWESSFGVNKGIIMQLYEGPIFLLFLEPPHFYVKRHSFLQVFFLPFCIH